MIKILRWLIDSAKSVAIYTHFFSRIHVHKICCDSAAEADRKRVAKVRRCTNSLNGELIALLLSRFYNLLTILCQFDCTVAIASNIFQNPIKTLQYFQYECLLWFRFCHCWFMLCSYWCWCCCCFCWRKIKLNLYESGTQHKISWKVVAHE